MCVLGVCARVCVLGGVSRNLVLDLRCELPISREDIVEVRLVVPEQLAHKAEEVAEQRRVLALEVVLELDDDRHDGLDGRLARNLHEGDGREKERGSARDGDLATFCAKKRRLAAFCAKRRRKLSVESSPKSSRIHHIRCIPWFTPVLFHRYHLPTHKNTFSLIRLFETM